MNHSTHVSVSVPEGTDPSTGFDFADPFWLHLFWLQCRTPVYLGAFDSQTLLEANPAFAELHGSSPDTLQGLPLLTLFPEPRHSEASAFLQQVSTTDYSRLETEHIRRDGSVFPVRLEASAIRDAEGKGRFLLIVVHDQSKWQSETNTKIAVPQAQETEMLLQNALRAKPEAFTLLNAVAAASPVGICLLDCDLRFQYVNPKLAEMDGIPIDQHLGRRLEAVLPVHGTRMAPHLHRVIATGEPLNDMEVTVTTWQAEQRHFLANYYPVRDASDAVVGVGGAIQEITERKRSDIERATLLSGARCLLWYADIYEQGEETLAWKQRLPDVEAAWHFLPIRRNPGETYLRAWYLHRLEEDRIRCDREGTEAIRAGRSYVQEFRVRCADDSVRWVREDVRVETGEPGKQWRCMAVATDVTEQKLREAEVNSLNLRLQRAMTETHHRVKNNLQIIAALAEMQLEDDTEMVPRSALQRIADHVRTLATVHDVLTQQVRTDARIDSMNTAIIFRQLIPLMRTAVGMRNIRYQVADLVLPINRGASLSLLINELVSNAVKHGSGDVEISLCQENTLARLQVCDDGPGFPAEFDPLRHANIGMELIYSLARHDLSGDIHFENRPEGGARITVTFPLT